MNSSAIISSFDNLFPHDHRTEVKQKLAYGTAGFRMKADSILDRVVFTVGLLACLRALDKKESVGVMITASHNGAQDNGVKLVDPTGEMLESTWEEKAVRLANCIHDAELMREKFDELVSELKLDLTQPPIVGKTLCISVAKDTRTSSDRLVTSLKTAVALFGDLGIVHVDYGLMITPQLHYMVMLTNHHEETKTFLTTATKFSSAQERQQAVQEALVKNESIYYQDISNAFNLLYRTGKEKEITVDCAFGVGGRKIKQLQTMLSNVKFNLINDYETIGVEESQKYLNHDCGAEHVQKLKAVPINCENLKSVASIDGDGDRLVYFFRDESNELVLLDGDKIATLLVKLIGELLTKTGLLDQLIVGVVQTAYANGSSTSYLKQILGEQRIFCVPTGVKYLHHKAKELDVGIYFEANGHGTVIFSEKANKAINEMYNQRLLSSTNNNNSEFVQAISDLYALTKLINPTVGDAFSDLLAVEVALGYYGWNYVDWDKNLYTDVPSVQDKLKVRDRTIIKVSADETQVVSPSGIQDKINECVSKVSKGRAFIRPSGTEDVVRVYAEAETKEEAKELAIDVLHIIYNDLNGTEQPPAKSSKL